MRILFVSPQLRTIKGKNIYQIQLANLARGFKNYKHFEVYYAIPEDDISEFLHQSKIDENHVIGINIKKTFLEYSPLRIGILGKYLPHVEKLIKDICPDVIVSMEDFTYLTLQLCFMKTKYKFKLLIYHGPYYFLGKINNFHKAYTTLISKNIYPKYVDMIIAKTELAKQFLRKIYKIPIIKIPPAIDTDLFKPKTMKKQNKILYVGRIDWEKGYDILIKVIIELHKDNLFEFTIITTRNKYSLFVEKFIKRHSLAKTVDIQYNRPIQEIVNEYNKALITLNTSRYEIFGMTIAESISCSTPVIATPTGGSKEIIINGVNGIIINSYNPVKLYETTLNLFTKHYDQYRHIITQCRKTIINRFSINVISAKWTKLISEILE